LLLITYMFYSRGASNARAIAIIACLSVCLSVCVCVTRRYCIKTAKRSITQTIPRDSPGTLVFWCQNSLVDDPLSLWNLRSNRPTPFQTAQFRPIFAHSASTVRAGKKVQLVLIASRLRAFQRAIDEPCTLPLTPQRVAQNAILLFFSKFQLLSKKSLLQSFFMWKLPATKFYLHHSSIKRSIDWLRAKICAQGDPPLRKRRFRQISLNSAAAVRSSENCNYR